MIKKARVYLQHYLVALQTAPITYIKRILIDLLTCLNAKLTVAQFSFAVRDTLNCIKNQRENQFCAMQQSQAM